MQHPAAARGTSRRPAAAAEARWAARPARLALLLLAALSLAAPVAAGIFRVDDDPRPPPGGDLPPPRGQYIVRLKHRPAATYPGDIDGLGATQAFGGAKLDIKSASVAAYRAFLSDRVTTVASDAGAGGQVTYQYNVAFPGFAAGPLSDAQVAALRGHPDVADVVEDVAQTALTSTTPRFIGLAGGGLRGAGAAWDAVSGPGSGAAHAGEDIVIGVLDSGYAIGHPSFSDRTTLSESGPYAYSATVEGFNGTLNGRKVVGCRYFQQGWKALPAGEVLSCNSDMSGHGSHAASTAAGNWGAKAPYGVTSGMAPRARLAIYKVCWGAGEATCMTSDIVAGIEQAAADGVDILNFSLTGGFGAGDVISIAFLNAAAAGVVVTAAAGNTGRYAAINAVAPWVITVGATTHSRQVTAVLTTSGHGRFTGAGLYSDRVGPAPLATGGSVGVTGGNATAADLCIANSLDPIKAAGLVIVCDRGENGRLDKSAEVSRVGGVGMVFVNTPQGPDELTYDYHKVPTVHLALSARDAVRALAEAKQQVTLLPSRITTNNTAPRYWINTAWGPAPGAAAAVLKPDLVAPGAAVYAAVHPANGFNRWDFMSGTSMAAPHVAGLAALLKQKHPTWSPSAIKSALMTTTFQETRSGTPGLPIGPSPFVHGSGHVDARAMLNPGLVFDSDYRDWLTYLCAVAPAGVPSNASCAPCESDPAACAPRNVNVPSVALPQQPVGAAVEVVRRLKSVLAAADTWTAQVLEEVPGVSVTFDPQEFTLGPGEEAEVKIRFVAQAAPAEAGGYVFGAAAWTSRGAGTRTRIPLAVQPVQSK